LRGPLFASGPGVAYPLYPPLSTALVEHLEEGLQTCCEQIGQDVIDSATGQFRKRLSLVVATGGGHIEHHFD